MNEYQTRLEGEKTRLEAELKTVGRRNPANPNDWEPTPPPETQEEPDPVDAADYSEGFDANASIVADLETRYNAVTAALGRIADGTYGTCQVCGAAIEPERLRADPSAATCTAHLQN